MKKTFYLHFENGLPKGTAQQKGETIKYKANGQPYIQHYRKNKISAARTEFILRMKKHAPKVPTEKPVRLIVFLCFDIQDRKLWGKYKTRRPDADGYLKEFLDAMTDCGFWKDDAQVADLRVVKTYAEKGSITVTVEELEDPKAVRV